MSENYDDYDPDQDDDAPQPERNPLRQQMKRMEKELKTLREQATAGEQATRALEFAKAGINLADPRSGVFVRGYDGELTPEAIKASGEQFGLLAPTDAPTAQVNDPDRAAHERMDAAVAGSQASTGRDFDAEMRSATTPKDLDRIAQEKHFAEGRTGPAVVQF